MIEKVNPCHPDKVADRIAGAMVDLAYEKQDCPKVAVEVLIGHGQCTIIAESSYKFEAQEVADIIKRITKCEGMDVTLLVVPQDEYLAGNQEGAVRCGDNGIFKGCPVTEEQRDLSELAHHIFAKFRADGKYILSNGFLTICQSNATTEDLFELVGGLTECSMLVNPLGDWTGGTDVDSGATNRKLGSDMGDGVTGGGLHGKDLSKADVSVNIFCHLLAQEKKHEVKACCSIGDEFVLVDGVRVPYAEIVKVAKEYIKAIGGFEKFAEWGLF